MTDKPAEVHEAASVLVRSRRVVVFTGAGVSAESGIPTFRDAGGLWEAFPPERFATWSGLLKTATSDPRRFGAFVLAVLEPIAAAEPNAAHRAISDLERHIQVTVITQNIDGLHQAAGSTAVHEVHGSLLEIVTLEGLPLRLISRDDVRRIVEGLRGARDRRVALPGILAAVRPMLGLGWKGAYRPNVVLFGEMMAEPAWTRAQEAARECDCLIAVGTSGSVFPAAGLPDEARAAGATVISVNPESSGRADAHLIGPASQLLPALVETAFGGR